MSTLKTITRDTEAPTIDASFVEMGCEDEARLPAAISIERLANIAPAIEGHQASDGRLIDALAALPEGERTGAVLRLAQRQAAVARSIEAHEGRRERGLLQDAQLSYYWRSMGGKKRVIALKQGKAFGIFPAITRVEVWECRDNRWVGYAWEGRKRTDIVEDYPGDYPLHQALAGYEIVQGVQKSEARAPLIDLRLTNADHALHDLQRAGRGVTSYRAFLKAVNDHNRRRAAEMKLDEEATNQSIAEAADRRGRLGFLVKSIVIPVAVMALILALF